jgi:hypothetical protein
MIKRFSGILNTDDSPYDVLRPQHIHAKNIRYVGGQNGLTAQNIKGNYLIPNSNLPAGTNECIGVFFDDVNQQIIFFNYNSNGNHGIYSLSIQTESITQVFRCGVNSATDILNFSLNYPVTSAAIIYRTVGEGDLLYWTDGTNSPKYINLSTVSALSPFTSSMLNTAKDAPLTPPGNVSFQSDVNVNYNAVRNKLFRFAYRWICANGEKTTISPLSDVPLPMVLDPNEQTDPTVDNYIEFEVYSAETEDYTGIEVFMQVSDGSTWGDLQRIDILDRTEYNIPVSSSYTYKFYNNGGYIFITTDEADLYYSYVPQKANTLETLNGNVIIYGGITEGYPALQRSEVDVTVTATTTTGNGQADATFKWGCDQRFGLVYFDQQGRPIGGVISYVTDSAIDTNDFSVTTLPYASSTPPNFYGTIPQINATINHTPPAEAVSYQWVRVNLTPKFLHWVTMDYQTDNNYIYLGIQNLFEFNSSSGFLPSYEFTEGDMVRIIARYNGNGDTTVYSLQQTFPVIGLVDRTMTSPASTGKFLKIPKQTSVTPAYSANMFIEIYTPLKRLPDNQQVFYEWGQKYDIYENLGQRYHRGQNQDQTSLQPATFTWTNGDVYAKYRAFYKVLPVTGTTPFSYLYLMDANWNDYVPSASNANGRAWVIEENAATVYNGVLVRWGGKFQAGTSINQLNIFRPSDFDEADRGKGDIRRFKARDRILRAFQDRGVGQWGIYARFIQNNQGQSELVTTNEIITTNNINYYSGVYGLCGYPTNLCSTPYADYFTDVVTGRGVRIGNDGITDLGVLYKGQYFFPEWVLPYNREITRTNGSIAKVMAFFDEFDNDFHTILQGGTLSGTTYADRHFSFNEPRNGYVNDELNYIPEYALSANGVIYAFKNGQMYKHGVSGNNYCNFFGVQYDAEVTLVFNDNIDVRQYWLALAETSNDTWDCPEIYTDVMSYGTQRQQTSLVAQEFRKLEGKPSSAIKRDANSRGGKINGDFMKGSYLVVKLRKQNANTLITLTELEVKSADSPYNLK